MTPIQKFHARGFKLHPSCAAGQWEQFPVKITSIECTVRILDGFCNMTPSRSNVWGHATHQSKALDEASRLVPNLAQGDTTYSKYLDLKFDPL